MFLTNPLQLVNGSRDDSEGNLIFGPPFKSFYEFYCRI